MIRNWLRNFMIGRYGPDQLYVALMILALLLMLVSMITGLSVFSIVAYALLLLALLRMFSRNVYKRRAENDRFLRFWWPVRQKIAGIFKPNPDRKTHKYFKCPACKKVLRVPKGKGRIQITCPKCGERFQKKT